MVDGTSLDAALAQGVAAHQAGRLEQALAAYNTALTLAPADAEALSLSGLALAQLGRPAEALPRLWQALEREPGQVGFRLNLVEGLVAAGDPGRALGVLAEVLAAQPGQPRATARLADLFPAGAAALVDRRDWTALQAAANSLIRLQPARADGWRMAARAAFEQGRHRDAVAAFERLLALAPPTAADLSAFAGLCLHALDLAAAGTALERAASLQPDLPSVLQQQALLHLYHGRFEAAEDCCRRCLAQDPENVAAYSILSRTRRGRLEPAATATLQALAQRPGVPLDRRIPAAFAVAHAHDARGDVDAAFAAYGEAHALALERDRLEGRRHDPAADERRGELLQRLFPAAPPRGAPLPAGPRPIFIVGMPRSGTTLVESVLGAHSRVFAGGERPAMRQLLRARLALAAAGQAPTPALLQHWVAAYLREFPATGRADHVTDKHPLNFEALGLIAELFPHAAIVHVRRDPLETCLSIYRQEFNKLWGFAHRLADIGRYYGCYARLMAHWEQSHAGRFTTVQYEEFTADFAQAAPALLAACGLDWQPQCLQFQRSGHAIATFSTVQARDPVTVRNGRAAQYARHLGPLREALAAAGVDLVTGALAATGARGG